MRSGAGWDCNLQRWVVLVALPGCCGMDSAQRHRKAILQIDPVACQNLMSWSLRMTLSQCYAVLEIPPGSSFSDIKRSYRDLVRVWHPDRFEQGSALQLKAQSRLAQINEAYEMLEAYSENASKSETGSSSDPTSGRYAAASARARVTAWIKHWSILRSRPGLWFASAGVFLQIGLGLQSAGNPTAIHFVALGIADILCAIGGTFIANAKGQNPAWGILGVIPCLGLLVIVLLEDRAPPEGQSTIWDSFKRWSVFRSRTGVYFVFSGAILQVLGFLLYFLNDIIYMIIISDIGVLLFCIGLSFFAKAKGRSRAWGFLGITSLFGLWFITRLEDRA